MKRTNLILTILLVLAFSVFAIASGESETSTVDQGSGSANASSSVSDQGSGNADNSSGAEVSEDNTLLGDYSVVIDSCRLAKDYSGKPVVIVKYIFTNVSDDDATSFSLAIEENVYQDGVGLNTAIIIDDNASYSSDNQLKKIKKGASLDVEVAYELNDTTTDIEVEVKEFISFNDKTIKKTFSIAE